jgi:hypothetical protein
MFGTGAGPLWVKRVAFVMSAVCPVYPQQQTSPDTVGTSHLCQERKWQVSAMNGSERQSKGKPIMHFAESAFVD